MLAGILHDIGHRGFAPPLVNRAVTRPASGRTDVMSGSDGWPALGEGVGVHGSGFRQIANERDKLPGLLVRQLPTGHAGVPNAITNEIKQLAVRSFPFHDSRTAQVKRGRIQSAAGGRLSTPIVSMTDLAVLPI